MAMRGIVASGLMAVAAAGVAQDVPVAPAPEIVVEGARPQVDAGAWTIHQWPSRTINFSPGGHGTGRQISSTPGWTARTCIADAGVNDAIARLLGRDNAVTPPGCSPMRIRIGKGRLTGRRDCTRMMALGGELRHAVMESATRYTGVLAQRRIDVRLQSRTQDNGEDVAETTGRLTAERTGPCAPVVAVRRSAPLPLATGKTIPAPGTGVTSLALPETVSRGDVAAVAPIAPPTAASADDIVVVARRLRKLRLTYASTGRTLSSCRTSISSGDRRVDRIGCAIVRACVREGFGEPGWDIACFRRKVNSLEPD